MASHCCDEKKNGKRCCHLVGSLPLENESIALKICMEKLGHSIRTFPDGEIGEKSERFPGGNRQSWVQLFSTKCLEEHSEYWYSLPMKEEPVVNDKGFVVDFKYLPELRSKSWSNAFIKDMPLTYLECFEKNYP